MKLYDQLASWWPLMSPPVEYVEEAAFYAGVLDNAAARPIRSVLELGSGGGSNAFHLKRRYPDIVLVDLSEGMLDVSRALNPELVHHRGDMRTIRLHREFDAVFVHDAICYMTSEADVRQVFESAYLHCAPGGVALFAPDYLRENFQPGTDHGGYDAADGSRGMRWVEWRWDPDPSDTSYVVDYGYLLRESDGSVHVEHDRHVEGLFTRAEWLRWLADAGFDARVVPLELTEVETQTLEVFVGIRRPCSADHAKSG